MQFTIRTARERQTKRQMNANTGGHGTVHRELGGNHLSTPTPSTISPQRHLYFQALFKSPPAPYAPLMRQTLDTSALPRSSYGAHPTQAILIKQTGKQMIRASSDYARRPQILGAIHVNSQSINSSSPNGPYQRLHCYTHGTTDHR